MPHAVGYANPELRIELGAEDVFRFTGNETHTDYFRLVLRDANYLLVGGSYDDDYDNDNDNDNDNDDEDDNDNDDNDDDNDHNDNDEEVKN
ncbi:hypothetical protein HZH68_011629 [Vespula germanica]|uniref:Uncharacterized protein n=1 Tax=Vespula germanica TaxID=30212 RepID=A0A834JV19_VESGE|nr:hypothetical protein HZH68_011629 [Vespula germanica]